MDSQTDPIQALRQPGRRLTRQRRLVLDILNQAHGHPDARMIFQEALKRDDRISLATVYRSLDYLKKAGLVEENTFGEDHGHFETIQESHHYHFTCIGCGQVVELKAAGLSRFVQSLSEPADLQVTEIHLFLRGFCPDCQNNPPQTKR